MSKTDTYSHEALLMGGVIFLFLTLGLWLDQQVPLWGQDLSNVLAWTLFAWVLWRWPATQRGQLLLCLLFATGGELFLALFWGLYSYRLGNLPLFVPPGHVLLFVLGTLIAPHLPRSIVYWVPLAALPFVLFGLFSGHDQLGGLLFAFFLAALLAGHDRPLYATMFVLSLLLEIYGTWLGNWTWHPQVPLWGLTNTNPPLAGGALYCILDLLVLMSSRLLPQRGNQSHENFSHAPTALYSTQ